MPYVPRNEEEKAHIDAFLKKFYEDALVQEILLFGSNFVKTEMNDESYVDRIMVELVTIIHNGELVARIYTEDSDHHFEATDKFHNINFEELKAMVALYGDVLITDDGIRQWYDSYLVPRLIKAYDVTDL